ncbi:MAG: HTH-type transcriptional regulator BhcR [Paracoccaceae bacterium]
MQPIKRRKGRPKGFDTPTGQSTIQSLDRALNVLDALAASSGMTLTEVSEYLDQSPATIYRVLSTLEARGIVEIDPQDQAWHIGAMAFRLGSAFLRRSSVVERSRPVMRHLMEATGETSNLGIERNGDVMFVSQIETHESIRAFFPPGTLSPMHASGIGKALLSQYPEDRIVRFLRDRQLEQFTEKTFVEADALMHELQTIRERGFAFDDEEKTMGMRCVAAPILNFYGEAIAGISVSGPTNRMTERQIDQIGALVRDAAARVSRGLGGQDAV